MYRGMLYAPVTLLSLCWLDAQSNYYGPFYAVAHQEDERIRKIKEDV